MSAICYECDEELDSEEEIQITENYFSGKFITRSYCSPHGEERREELAREVSGIVDRSFSTLESVCYGLFFLFWVVFVLWGVVFWT